MTVMDTNDRFFRDDQGRVVFLRGVNLSSNAKLPYEPYMPTHQEYEFFDDTQVSFVGRPFPLSEASQHFQRLQLWGFNFLRFCVTWESLEHAGPGCYDTDYMDYVVEVLTIAKEYGFQCFIDPHQDVWSRSCGGSGAPGWTLRMAGLEPQHFHATNAALVQNTFPSEKQFPRMIWPTNYFKLAAATMFTLFFAGSLYAPKLNINIDMKHKQKKESSSKTNDEGENIQNVLQDCFIQSFCALAQRLKAAGLLDCMVIGYDTLNEPSAGWIGVQDLNKFLLDQELRHGLTPTPIQCMKLGHGMQCDDVAYYEMRLLGPTLVGARAVDPNGVRAWRDDVSCIWADHGVWSTATGKLLVPDYFHRHPETQKPIDFLDDCWKPFVRKFTKAIRAIHQNAIMFVEPTVLAVPPKWRTDEVDPDRVVYAPHFYDGLTLIHKKFYFFNINLMGVKRGQYSSFVASMCFGIHAIKNCMANQLHIIKTEGLDNIGNVPCVIGEIGIPFDMDKGKSYITGDYSQQIRAMDASLSGLESNLLSYTLWNYCPDNSHERGDQWNGEDLSIFSVDDAERVRPNSDSTLPTLDGGGTNSSVDNSTSVDNSSSHHDPPPPLPSTSRKLAPKSSVLLEPFDPYLGGRALAAVIRPYPKATCGVPLSWTYDYTKRLFHYKFENDKQLPTQDAVTLIYLPPYIYPSEKYFTVWVSDGTHEYDNEAHLLFYMHSDLSLPFHEIKVEPIPGPGPCTFCEKQTSNWSCNIL